MRDPYSIGYLPPKREEFSLEFRRIQIMQLDFNDVILQFSAWVIGFWIMIALVRHYRALQAKPRGTYANGQPERRRRPRFQMPDPATMTPRPVAPGEMI